MRLGSSDKATILEFIRWSCHYKESEEDPNLKYHMDGHWWMQDSYAAWRKRMPWLSEKTIQRYLIDLHAKGDLDKRTNGKMTGGRVPNFYRVIEVGEVKGQNDQDKLKDNLSIVKGQSDLTIKDKMSFSFISTKNQTKDSSKESPKTPKISPRTWQEDDEFAAVFTQLTRVATCRRAFHRETYRKWLKAKMEEQALNMNKLTELSKGWADHYTNPGAPTATNPLARFSNWIKKHFEWGMDQKNDNTGRVLKKERMGEQGYSAFDDDLLARINAVPG